MKAFGLTTALAVFLFNSLHLTEAQDLPLEPWEEFISRMAYETELESRADHEVEGIESYQTFYQNVEDALESQPDRLPEIIAAVSSDPAIAAAMEDFEWLHGIDIVTFQGRSELPGRLVSDGLHSQATVWVVGWNGLILHSDDYGASWATHELTTTENFQAVDFADDDFGVVVGHGGILLRTIDGGKNWNAARTDASDLHRSVDCTDKSNCWVVGDYDHVYQTSDGGQSWKKLAAGFGSEGIDAIKMLSPEVGLLGASYGIWRTTDGGVSWERTYTTSRFFNSWDRTRITAIDTADGVHLWAVGHGRKRGEIIILKSEDSGNSWESQTGNIRAEDYLSFETEEQAAVHRATSVSAVSAKDAYVAATNGVIIATIDGGENWWLQLATSSANDSIHGMDMIDGTVGWTVGNLGQVLATNTGGLTWVPQRGIPHLTYLRAGVMLGLEPGVASIFELRRLIIAEEFDRALGLSAALRTGHPGDADVLREVSQLHYKIAAAASNEGMTQKAIKNYSRAIEMRDGDYPSARNNRAILYAKQGEFEAALADINAAIAISPEGSLYVANRCLIHRLQGNLPKALADCEAAVSLGLPLSRENRSWVLLQRGLIRRMTGNVDGAVDDFQASVSNAKSDTIEYIQKLLQGAGLYSGPTDGLTNDELDVAIEDCVRNDTCFDQASEQMTEVVDFMR
jgi:photosystem II stability/assembly factor-like uncharacterized protein/Flp pilus assembly protein TadD